MTDEPVTDRYQIRARWPGGRMKNVATASDLTPANRLMLACLQEGALETHQVDLRPGDDVVAAVERKALDATFKIVKTFDSEPAPN